MANEKSVPGAMTGSLKRNAHLFRRLLLRGYRGKVLLVAFAGLHLPLISLAFYASVGFGNTWAILVVALVVTLLGTAATLYVLNAILTPVSLVSQALRDYVEHGQSPDLPAEDSSDLVSDVRYTMEQVERMDRAMQALEELSVRDHLTGAYNRRGCEQHLEEDLARLRRSGGVLTLTLAMLDLDQFKSINDEYGHQAGDACLEHIVNVMDSYIRRGDWIARWGGDEFVLALWDVQPESLDGQALDRIVKALHEIPVRLPRGTEIWLQVSGGVYRCMGDEDVQRCFAFADNALRRAKREGRSYMIYEA